MADLVDRMRADLMVAMRSKERATVRVLRSTLAAVANAEAQPDTANGPASLNISGGIAGATPGLASTEVERRTLTDDEISGIVAAERDERLEVAADLAGRGAAEQATSLRAEAAVLDGYL